MTTETTDRTGPLTRLIQGDGFRHSWGIRRADGQPWRTEPSVPGKHDYYAINDEVSSDGMVMGCGETAAEAASCMLSQAKDPDVPHAGAAVVVRAVFRHDVVRHEWGYVYEDVSAEELARRLSSEANQALRTLAELYTFSASDEGADQ